MRIHLPVLCLLVISALQLKAQKELANPLVDSKEAIEKGVALHDEGKYKDAIKEYLKVAPSDTGYSSTLHELILSFYNDSNFVVAENYARLALELYPENNTEWYSMLADIYDDTKRSDLALKAYDTIIAQSPYNYLVYFNKGITLFRLERYDEATTNFQRCVMLNPYYASAHYSLGKLAMLKGNMVQAMLSFATSLISSPGHRNKANAINFMNMIAEVNTTATEYLQNYKPAKTDDFEDIQDILVSKAALVKNYKLKAELEDRIVRQLQVIMEKLEYNPNDHGFWMQYYVSLYKGIWDRNEFAPFVFYMFSEVDLKPIKEYNKKEKKKIEAFTDGMFSYLGDVRESNELIVAKREKASPRFYISKYLVSGKGDYGKTTKNESVVIGPWEFYYTNGRLKSKGVFNAEGGREGEWKYYYENGLLKEVSNFVNDKAEGKSESWHDNGLLYTKSTFAKDNLEGLYTAYYYSGRLRSQINYKASKKEGLAKYYNVDGYLSSVENYMNDLLDGDETTYYEDGKISSTAKYTKDEAIGEYKSFHENGKLKLTGNYNLGKKIGLWQEYYEDGKPETVENYVNGDLEGESVSYYENGKIASKYFYKKGEIDGKEEDFDDDGILFSESMYERGRLRDIKFFDKKGTVISNTTSRKGNANIAFFTPDGSKKSEGYYSKDGTAEGKFLYYYKNGKLKAESAYKNGLEDGKKTSYFSNGKISEEGTYRENKPNGYFISYYNNGQVSEEGWYVDGEREGTFINYDLLGKVVSKIYYLNGTTHGITENYTATGKLDYKQYYDRDWLNKIHQYDSAGKILSASALDKGNGVVRFDHFNGKSYFESNYRYYRLNGAYKVTNGDGSKRSLAYYKNGNIDSNYVSWYPNGKIQLEGVYVNGKKTGAWKFYTYNGKLVEVENYKDGALHGEDIQYDINGKITKKNNYKNGNLDGDTEYFDETGQLMLIMRYDSDELKGYTYEDKSGKLLPMIAIEKGTGVVDAHYKNGARSVHMVLNEGLVDGERNFYHSNGKEQLIGSRINGLQHGSYRMYYPSGKILRDINYYYGQVHGSAKEFNEDGSLVYEENYYLGNLHGECKYYTAGKLAATYLYHFNMLESKK